MQEFSSFAVRNIIGVSQRTLDYWDERGIVGPSKRQARGKGTGRKYLFDDLIELSVVKRLRDTGLSLQKIREGLVYLRKNQKRPLRDTVLVTDGKDLFKKVKDESLVSVLRKSKGQKAFSVVFLGRIPDEIEDSIQKLERKQLRRSG